MIRISSNKHNCKRSFSPLKISDNGITYDDEKNIITIKCADKHCLLTNDNVVLKREDGRNISFIESVPVEGIINPYVFTINGFKERFFTFDSYEVVSIHDINGKEMTYYKCDIKNDDEHIFLTNKDDVSIRGYYYWNEKDGKFDYGGKINLCKNEYVLVDNVLLYEVIENGVLGEDIKNILNAKIRIFNDFNTIHISNCLISVNVDGADNRRVIYIPYEGNEGYVDFLKNGLVYSDDIRFFHGSGDNSMVFGNELQHGTTINKINGDLEFEFNISEDFATNLFENELFSNYCEDVKEKSINDIIDYERHQYTPMYYSGKNYEDINDDNINNIVKLSFNLNFRGRIYDEKIRNIDGRVIGYDYGSWTNFSNGEYYWNSDKNGKLTNYLTYLGFTDEDVFYQKEALKRSFLRLLFYDSKNIATQQLLFYSTIYFDTNSFSKKYLKIKNVKVGKGSEKPYIERFDICSELYCGNKYDDECSSDGFYLHLYDKMVFGNTTSKIYMKVEFNNAKTGVVVPFVWTKDGKYLVEQETGDNENTTIMYNDVEKLLDDMYKEVYLKYNFKTKKYNWILPYNGVVDNGKIKYDLYEAVLLKNE